MVILQVAALKGHLVESGVTHGARSASEHRLPYQHTGKKQTIIGGT